MSTRATPPSAAPSKAASYDLLAPFYERHWGADFLHGAQTMYAQWLAPRLPTAGARILDVCCGDGGFAAWLGAVHHVTGVDLSRPMIDLARAKAPKAIFAQADMRSFRLDSRFDAAVCFYNSVNQAMTSRGLRATFSSIAAHLQPRGWLLFDFIDETTFLRTWEFEETAVAGDRMCHLRYRYNPKTRVATCRALLDGQRTVVRQRPLERAEIREALAAAGFIVKAIGRVVNVSPRDGRSVVLARLRSGG
jgi:SAM-dependent methyltransferase